MTTVRDIGRAKRRRQALWLKTRTTGMPHPGVRARRRGRPEHAAAVLDPFATLDPTTARRSSTTRTRA